LGVQGRNPSADSCSSRARQAKLRLATISNIRFCNSTFDLALDHGKPVAQIMDPDDIPLEPTFDPAEFKLLLDQLDAENETISFLLKTHLFAEYQMDRLLADYLGEKREPLYRIDLRWHHKLSLIDSFALLPEECIRSLRALNKLRNRCVHTFNTRPTMEDVRQVAPAFSAFLPRAEHIQTVPEFLKAYMFFLFGYFSAGGYDLKRRKEA
jgi:hypothetical protein